MPHASAETLFPHQAYFPRAVPPRPPPVKQGTGHTVDETQPVGSSDDPGSCSGPGRHPAAPHVVSIDVPAASATAPAGEASPGVGSRAQGQNQANHAGMQSVQNNVVLRVPSPQGIVRDGQTESRLSQGAGSVGGAPQDPRKVTSIPGPIMEHATGSGDQGSGMLPQPRSAAAPISRVLLPNAGPQDPRVPVMNALQPASDPRLRVGLVPPPPRPPQRQPPDRPSDPRVSAHVPLPVASACQSATRASIQIPHAVNPPLGGLPREFPVDPRRQIAGFGVLSRPPDISAAGFRGALPTDPRLQQPPQGKYRL